jgi:hypothetical protein
MEMQREMYEDRLRADEMMGYATLGLAGLKAAPAIAKAGSAVYDWLTPDSGLDSGLDLGFEFIGGLGDALDFVDLGPSEYIEDFFDVGGDLIGDFF